MNDQEIKLVENLKKQYAYLKNRRNLFESQWDEIFRLTNPRLEGINETRSDAGKEKGIRKYDDTSGHHRDIFVDGMTGQLSNARIEWEKMVPRNLRLRTRPDVLRYLEERNEVLKSILEATNFYDQSKEAYGVSVDIGHGCLFVAEDVENLSIIYESVPTREIYIAENHLKQIDTVFRERQLPNRDLFEKFGEEAFTTGERDEIKNNPYGTTLIYHAVFPRKDRDYYSEEFNTDMPFQSVWYTSSGTLLKVSGYKSIPYIVPIMFKQGNEEYGRGLGNKALTTTKRINSTAKGIMQTAQLKAQPPVLYPEEMEDRRAEMMFMPQAQIPYMIKGDKAFLPQKFDVGGEYPIGKDLQNDMRMQSREIYRADFFVLLSATAGQKLTATQVIEMRGEKISALTPIINNATGYYRAVLERTDDIIEANGWYPPIPESMRDIGEEEIDIIFTGPLAIAAQQQYRTQTLTASASTFISIAQFFPAMMDWVEDDELAQEILRAGFKERMIRSPQAVNSIRQARAQQQQALLEQQIAESQSKSYKNLTARPESGSPAEALR